MEEYKVLLEHGSCQLFLNGKSSKLDCHVLFLKNRIIQIKTKQNCHNLSKNTRRITSSAQNQNLIIELTLAYLVSFHYYMQSSLQNEYQIEFLQIKFKNKITEQKFRLVFLLNKNDVLQNFVEDYFTSYVWLRNFNIKYQIQKQISTQQKERVSNIYLIKQKLTKKKYWAKCYSKDSFFNDKNKNLQKIIANQIQNQQKAQKKHKIGFNKFYEDNSKFYLVYQQLPQKTLKQFLEQKKTNQFQLVKIKMIIKSLLKIIIELKKDQIVLRNLKSSNIGFLNLQESFKPYLLDFCRSSLLSSDLSINTANLFSPEYGVSAPQIFNKKDIINVTYKSDVFSVGIILFTMLFGKSPINVHERTKKLNNRSIKPYPEIDFKQLDSNAVTIQCLDFLIKILDYDPTTRIQPEVALHHQFLNIKKDQMRKSDIINRANKLLDKDSIKQQNQELAEPSLKKKISSFSSSCSCSPSKFMAQSKRKRAKVNKDKSDGNLDSSDLDDQHQFSIPISSEMKPSWENKKNNLFMNNTV